MWLAATEPTAEASSGMFLWDERSREILGSCFCPEGEVPGKISEPHQLRRFMVLLRGSSVLISEV